MKSISDIRKVKSFTAMRFYGDKDVWEVNRRIKTKEIWVSHGGHVYSQEGFLELVDGLQHLAKKLKIKRRRV